MAEASIIDKQYTEGLQYKKQMGYLTKWAEAERFKAGDQWAKPTEKTKNLPRPVLNIIKQIENHKTSSVMNENIKMIFSASEVADEDSPEFETADLYTRYADTTWEEVKQQELNEEALECASNVGTGIWHYYYDATKSGGNKLKYQGKICGEIIDPVSYFPGNPQNRNVQQQPYNIITYRDLVSTVREEAKNNGVSPEFVSMIKGDSDTQDQAYDLAKKELNQSDKVTVLVKYWKENGTVHFTKVASGMVIKQKTNTRLKLYPLIVMQWERRKQSIFGKGDTEELIPNQKSLNFIIAMQILSSQLTGFPKVIVDKSQVQHQITNTPGEVINVNSQNGNVGNAVQYMNPANIAASSFNLVDSLLSKTKEIAGANESALGEQAGGQLNASAIMMLQKAASVPLESIKRRFYQAMEDVGNVWADMWRVYYNTDRLVTVKTNEGKLESRVFNGERNKDIDMTLKVDIGASSSYSETLMMTSLDKLFDMQQITLEQYLQYAPNNVIPFKDRLLKSIQQQQEEQAQQQVMMEEQQMKEQEMANQQQQEEQMMMEQQAKEDEKANQPHLFDQILAQLPKHEQEAFRKLTPREQNAIMNQLMSETAPQE
ncbi:portal protein [Neobacillus drentensis]|uniref:portal protein n=1 Tax=Neobacillus drentensis TaxID=220684 RepID=UPI0030039303